MYCNTMYLAYVFMIVLFGPLKPWDKEDQIRWVWRQKFWSTTLMPTFLLWCVWKSRSTPQWRLWTSKSHLRLPRRTIRKGQNAWQLSVVFVQCGKSLLVNRVQLPAFKKVFHRAKGRGAIRLKKTRVLFAFLTVAYATSALYLALEIIVKRF